MHKRPVSEYVPDERLLNDMVQPHPLQRTFLPSGHETYPRPSRYNPVLINPVLPINEDRDRIVDMITAQGFRAGIVQSPTGSGKTLELPKIALETDLFSRIYLTQPTILGARTIAQRLATEFVALGADGGRIVGYQTATEGNSADHNSIQIVTADLLAHMAMSGGIPKDALVISDEFHMRKIGTDAAFSLCAMQGIKTVISSATIDAPFIARRAAEITRQDVPVITGKGKRFPVEVRKLDGLVSKETLKLIYELRSLGIVPKGAIILPGDAEIRTMRGLIKPYMPAGMSIVKMTGESSRQTHELAMADHTEGSLILATKILETSVTVPGMHFVVSSGWHRTGDWYKGAKSLPLEPISQASADQQMGRVGRTMPGIYIEAQLDGYPVRPKPNPDSTNSTAVRSVPSYERPEIERIDLSDIEMRLCAAGLSLNNLSLMTQPSRSAVAAAHERLRRIGAVEYGDLVATEVGKRMAEINLDSHYARMVEAAREHGDRIALQMIFATAALQTKGIGATSQYKQAWKGLTHEKISDVLAQLDVFIGALSMTDEEREKRDIIDRRFSKALEIAISIADRFKLEHVALHRPTDYERKVLFECSLKGYDWLFVRQDRSHFRGKDRARRTLMRSSVIELSDPHQFILGQALNIGYMGNKGQRTRKAIKTVTSVDIETLERVLPERMSYRFDGYQLTKKGQILSAEVAFFDETRTGQKRHKRAEPCLETDAFLCDAIASKEVSLHDCPALVNIYKALDELHDLQHRTDEDLGVDKLAMELEMLLLRRMPAMASSVEDVATVITHDDIRGFVDEARRTAIRENAPDSIVFPLVNNTYQSFEVSYIHNVLTIHVSPQDVEFLQLNTSWSGRELQLKVQGLRKKLSILDAKEYFGRGSRWYRRNQMYADTSKQVYDTKIRTVPTFGSSALAYEPMLSSLEATDNELAEFVVPHFKNKKGRRPGGRRGR